MKPLLLLYLLISSILFNSLNCSFQESLLVEINKKYNGENLIISPLSIFQALSLAANGAKNNTQSEMISALGSKTIDELNQINYDILEIFKEFSTVEIANAVMTRFSPLEKFTEVCENYLAPTELLKSAEQVNKWCSEKTHGKITEILKELSDDILMIILNAIYFKGEWAKTFNKDYTKEQPFYNLGTDKIGVDTMYMDTYFPYYQNEKFQAVSLGYLKDYMYALIILPSEKTNINDLINSFNSENTFSSIIDKLRSHEVLLSLPKFELEFDVSLKESLAALGIKDAFSSEADFTGLREEGQLFIGEVIQKAYLKVNEGGTEAAVVTGGYAYESDDLYRMEVNRPFLFAVLNDYLPPGQNTIFMAKIEKL